MAGRPPKPEGERRGKVLQIRLTDDEFALVEKASKGAKVSAWGRDELLKRAKRKIKLKNSLA